MYLAPDDKKRMYRILKGTSFSVSEWILGICNILMLLMHAFYEPQIQYAGVGLVVGFFLQVMVHVNSRFKALLVLIKHDDLPVNEIKVQAET
ncbi:hypothetical protein RGQ13_18470 [Thalassotalea psychrophila]|uniref:Orphan protein n=1 Tax=Thalassotalea psychrophila TaxID=3065647 RepID=A0ABY9TUE0_9GAMM|nr:hypothetical protein RGQ13_18470 [Colwelliaceae bacterium SQ149]